MPEAVATYAGLPSTATGAATGPGAGGIITGATLTLGIGRWEISVEASWGGTAGTADNIELKIVQQGVTVVIPLKMSGGASSIPSVNDRIVVQVFIGPTATPTQTAVVSVNAIAADGTGVYNVNLIARPLMV